MQELVPYFMQYFCTAITGNMEHGLSVLWNILMLLRAWVRNPHLRLELHIQSIVPVVLSVIVGKRVGKPGEDHWRLRLAGAQVISHVCLRYTPFIPDLTARVCKTYSDCFLPHRDVVTVYGGVCGIHCLGHGSVKGLIIPQLKSILSIIQANKLRDISTPAFPVTGTGTPESVPVDGKEDSRRRRLSELSVQQCEELMVRVLGSYIVTCMSLPTHGTGTGSVCGSVLAPPTADTQAAEELVRLKRQVQRMEEELRALRGRDAAGRGRSVPSSGDGAMLIEGKEAVACTSNGNASSSSCSSSSELLADYGEKLVPYYLVHASVVRS